MRFPKSSPKDIWYFLTTGELLYKIVQ